MIKCFYLNLLSSGNTCEVWDSDWVLTSAVSTAIVWQATSIDMLTSVWTAHSRSFFFFAFFSSNSFDSNSLWTDFLYTQIVLFNISNIIPYSITVQWLRNKILVSKNTIDVWCTCKHWMPADKTQFYHPMSNIKLKSYYYRTPRLRGGLQFILEVIVNENTLTFFEDFHGEFAGVLIEDSPGWSGCDHVAPYKC